MTDLHWSWLALPYVLVAVSLLAVVLVGVVVRGERVMRIGVIGAAATALPWAVCSSLSACTNDPLVATRLLRLGQGPVALIGPNFMLVLLGISGQLERFRWLARLSGVIGIVLLCLCWWTDWTVPTVQRLSSGLLYTVAGPLTDLHNSQLVIWLVIGAVIARISSSRVERRGLLRVVIAVLALGGIGAIDMLTVHGVWSTYPIAWLPALCAANFGLYLELRTDLLRKRGVDRGAVIEVFGFVLATMMIGAIAWLVGSAMPLAMVAISSVVWVLVIGGAWAVREAQPSERIGVDRAYETYLASLTDEEDDRAIVERLGALWKTVAVEVRTAWRIEGTALVELSTRERWELTPDAIAWLVRYAQPLAPSDLATMRLGVHRPRIEAMVSAHGASLLVPLVDRDALVGLVEADHPDALRDGERELLGTSARAAARALTYASLAKVAAAEGETAREVEVAEAMRLQASASRDDELGRWTVAAEYRTAPRTTGAGWSASLLADGRLAVLVTEAQAHGVAAALATAAITGAFAAATAGARLVELDDLLLSLRASSEGVMRGGEPIAAFIAVIDGDRQQVAWATAGHPGAFIVGPVAYDLAASPMGSTSGPRPEAVSLGGGGNALAASLATATRGTTLLPADSLLVIASSAVRGEDETKFAASVREQSPAGPRLAQLLVDAAAKRGEQAEDLLAVVVRQRPDRPSGAISSRT